MKMVKFPIEQKQKIQSFTGILPPHTNTMRLLRMVSALRQTREGEDKQVNACLDSSLPLSFFLDLLYFGGLLGRERSAMNPCTFVLVITRR